MGQSGIEKVYNNLLMGEDGAKRVVVNSVGRRFTLEEEPTEARLQLTVDYDVQKALEDGSNGRVSTARRSFSIRVAGARLYGGRPAYDPNAFAAGIDRGWAALNTDELRPIEHSARSGRYSQGQRSRWLWRQRPSKKGSSRVSKSTVLDTPLSSAARSSAQTRRTGVSDLRHAIEQSCSVFRSAA